MSVFVKRSTTKTVVAYLAIILSLFILPSGRISAEEGLPTGGTITTVGEKTVHVFTSSGTFTVPAGKSATVEYLIVGGGGGGGGAAGYNDAARAGAGGGAGGYRTGNITVTEGTYTVTVGAGGAGGIGGDGTGGQGGQASVFNGISAAGGGGGGGSLVASPNPNGGSGGGWGGLGNTPATDPAQGYDGGIKTEGYIPQSPGGGGASSPGQSLTGPGVAAYGGPGLDSSITGVSTGYAGGGGGGSCCSVSNGSCTRGSATHGGGAGGMGPGISAIAGVANTGGGGGGGGYNNGEFPTSGAAGGSGIVVISYTTVEFMPKSTITATAGGNGSISPSGSVEVSQGANQTFAITPNENYKVADVLVDGSSVGAVSSYTFSNVTVNHTISATFAINTYSINAVAGANGAISPSGTISADHGSSQTFTITPNEGYHVADILVGGVSAGAAATYTFENIGTPPPPTVIEPAAASGGTVTTVGNKTIHTFSTNGTFTVPEGVTGNIEVLVVAGGGGGAAGGGGGGGVVYNASYPVSAQTYAVTVGAGGSGATETTSPAASPSGTPGQDSSFAALVAKGGGGGGGNNAYPPNDPTTGGSGGGGGYSSSTTVLGAAGTDTQGYAGGSNAGNLVNPYPAGGGGGAGSAGGNATAVNVAGIGGSGLTFSISGSPVSYAGGGGGGVWGAGTAGTATHGGGAGGANAPGSSGTPNTGGGGGGAGYLQTGGNGGSGIVIVSYTTEEFGTASLSPYTINASFALNTYTVTASAGDNGTITPAGATTINYGGSQTYSVTPNENYHIVDVLVDGSSVGAVSTYEFTNVTANHTISATFAINNYTITSSTGANGTISPAGATSVNHGGTQAYTITPNENYKVADVLVDGSSVGAVSTYTFENVTAVHTISATFVINNYNITATAGENGSISPSGETTVAHTGSQTFTISPAEGYHVADVLIDGSSVGAVSTYEFANVTANHTISATFAINTYTITSSTGENGSISPTGETTINHGGSQAYTITPNEGYRIADVLIDGSSVGAVSTYEFANVTANHTISATSELDVYQLAITKTGTGTGTVTSTPAGINCGETCSYNYNAGTSVTLTATPEAGSTFSGWTGACTGTDTCVLAISEAKNASAEFTLNSYTITATAGDNGSIAPTGETVVNHGGTQAYTITPNEGYRVEVVLVDGSSVGSITEYEFSNVTTSHTISVTFTLDTHNITASASEGGSVTPSGVTAVNNGGSQSYTITANEGYHIVDVLVDGLSNGAISSYTFSNVNAPHTISATFVINTHNITATAGDNGAISPSGEVTVNQGANQTFIITPAEGYHIADILVDGSSVGAVSTYTFENVTGAHTISATFAINSYTVTATTGDNGSITPSGVTSVNNGGSQSYTITANEGYHIVDVLVDGSSVGAVATYGFSNVTANHTISATFAIETYTITASSGANGAISPAGATAVERGAAQTYTISPNEGYHIADVLVDGSSVGAVASYEFANVTTTHTISATFVINGYTIIATAGAGGSISPAGSTTLNHGSNQVYTITPDDGYFIEGVLVDDVSVGTVTSYEFANVMANHTIAVTFTQNTHTVTATAGENGSISPTGGATIVHGGSQSYTITANEGYHIVDVLVDGSSVGAVATYEITGIVADHTISATFAINSYTITATASGGGSITPSGIVNVDHGGSQSYTIAPDDNFLIGDITVNGSSVGAVSTYEFTNVTGNSTIAATFVRPLPVIGDITCPESTYPGQEITCTATATAVNGTVAYEWTATTGEVVDQTDNTLTVRFNTSGNKLITAKAYLTEDPQRYASSTVSVTVDEIGITLTLDCPEQAVKGEPFECSVVGETPIGSLSYKWSISNGSLTEEGDKATITPDRSGTISVKVTATHSDSPAVQKEASKTVTVIFTGEITPVIKGSRYPYINTPMTYTVDAPCITKNTCTVKIAVNGVEENSASAIFSFPEPGKYTITAETTLTDNGLKKTGQYIVYAEPMPKPLIYLQGPSAAFAEETTTYSASVAEKHKVLPVMLEWTLPDGSTSTESEVTLSPDTGGIVYLTCKAWVDGYRETTERVLTKRINVVAYVFPLPKIYVRFPEGAAPYPVSLAARNTVKPTPGAPYRIVYNWDFGDGETLTTQKDAISHIFKKSGSYLVRMTATDHKGNVTTDEVTINAGVPPLELALKMSSSNAAMRTPLTAYVRSSVTKRSSLDRLESHEWRINDTLVEGTQPEYLRTTFTEPGEYEVLYKAKMKSGTVGTKTLNVTVNPNTPPECAIEYTDYPAYKSVILKAVCTDTDGRLSSFKWDLDDGRGYRSGFTKITLPASISRVFNIKLQATDDAGGVTEVIREISIAR